MRKRGLGPADRLTLSLFPQAHRLAAGEAAEGWQGDEQTCASECAVTVGNYPLEMVRFSKCPANVGWSNPSRMLDYYIVRFLLSAESLAYMIAAWGWWRVWQEPIASRISPAAMWTGVGFFVNIAAIAAKIMLHS
jgi:hypothetical protein